MWTRRWIAAVTVAALALPVLAACGQATTTGSAGTPSGATPADSATSGSAPIQIAETGSSLMYPLFNIWQPAFQKLHPNVQVTTTATGSGTGIAQAISGLVQIGASDAYMADAQVKQHPDVLNIPLVISAQQINYNVPGLNGTHLKLDGAVVVGIYDGTIKYWDAAPVAALNAGVTLPHLAIVPVRRADGSGDTFLFTQFLTATGGDAWKATGFGTTVTWPAVAAEVASKGNQGVEQALKQTKGSIGYLGISWLETATKDGLDYAALQNKAGKFVLPAADTITAAVQASVGSTPPDERISLINAAGDNSYPIINFEYVLVNSHQPSAALASTLTELLTWGLDPNGGAAKTFLDQVHFVALPAAVAALSRAQIAKIKA